MRYVEPEVLDQLFVKALDRSHAGISPVMPEDPHVTFLSGAQKLPALHVEMLADIAEELGSAMLFSSPVRNMGRLFFILKNQRFIMGAVKTLHEIVFKVTLCETVLDVYWQTLLRTQLGTGRCDAPDQVFPGLDEMAYRDTLLKALGLAHNGRMDVMAELMKKLIEQDFPALTSGASS